MTQSGGQNRPMHSFMSNKEAEQQGSEILNQGQGIIGNMKSQNRVWRKGQQKEIHHKFEDSETPKIKHFMKPSD